MPVVRFIRHGQAANNLQGPLTQRGVAPLTDLGLQQAAAFAASVTVAPDLIVVSPYRRAQQTAAPLIERYAHVPVETWPVQELEYLSREIYCANPFDARMALQADFVKRGDPTYATGTDAESFTVMLTRVRAILAKLAKRAEASIFVFSHADYLQLTRAVILQPTLAPQDFKNFFESFQFNGIPHTGGFSIRPSDKGWGMQ